MTAAALTTIVVLLLGRACRVRPPARVPAPHDAGSRPNRASDRRRARPSRPRSHTTAVADWCEGVARAVRGGETLVGALRVTPLPAGVGSAADELLAGLERGVPLDRAADRPTDDRDLAVVLSVLRACAGVGGSPAEPLDRAAATLRARAADAAERRTHSAQARASALVMTVLPIAMLALLTAASPAVRNQVVTPAGALVAGLGLALNLAGWAWMRRTISRTVE